MKKLVKSFMNKGAYGSSPMPLGLLRATEDVSEQIQAWANEHSDSRLVEVSLLPWDGVPICIAIAVLELDDCGNQHHTERT
jgi:hypothetical protein